MLNDMILIPKHFIKSFPNNMELGAKVREFYHSEYDEPKENQWVCEYCGGDTSEVDSDYLVNTNHLECVIKMNP
jgi:hypothetical protein